MTAAQAEKVQQDDITLTFVGKRVTASSTLATLGASAWSTLWVALGVQGGMPASGMDVEVDAGEEDMEAKVEAAAEAKAYAERIANLLSEHLVIEDYRDPTSIHAQLLPRGGLEHPPVRLLKWEWMETRADKLRSATTDEERRALALPRRQDLERDEPEAFMSVERLKELPRKHGFSGFEVERLQAAASSYCWLTPAHPDPLGEQLVSLAEAIEKAEKK